MASPAALAMVNLDSPDPPAAAAFYGALLGWEITHSQVDASTERGSVRFGCCSATGPEPRPWGTR